MEDEAAAAAAAEAASQTEKHSLLSSNRSSSIKSGGSGIEGAASVIAFDTTKSCIFFALKILFTIRMKLLSISLEVESDLGLNFC
jgi:hypothetical protein